MPLSIEEIQKSINDNPKSVTTSDKYGKSLWVEVVEWSDGGLSASNYNSETKQGYKIGNNGKLKADTPPTNNATANKVAEKDFNFDM